MNHKSRRLWFCLESNIRPWKLATIICMENSLLVGTEMSLILISNCIVYQILLLPHTHIYVRLDKGYCDKLKLIDDPNDPQ